MDRKAAGGCFVTNQRDADPHLNGFQRDTISTFLRGCLARAANMGLSQSQILVFAEQHGLGKYTEGRRSDLNKFTSGRKKYFGSDGDTKNLYRFFTMTEIGRAVSNDRPTTIPTGLEVTKNVDLSPFHLLIRSVLVRSNDAPPDGITGNFYAYHAGISSPGYAVRAFRIERTNDGMIAFEDYLSEEKKPAVHNKGLVFCYADRPQFISIDINGRYMRFFIPMKGDNVDEMTGPMTGWTRDKIPANRFQRLVRTTDDFEHMKLETCHRLLGKLPPQHREQCLALDAAEREAAEELAKKMRSSEQSSESVAPAEKLTRPKAVKRSAAKPKSKRSKSSSPTSGQDAGG
jgi:hypothetical protein